MGVDFILRMAFKTLFYVVFLALVEFFILTSFSFVDKTFLNSDTMIIHLLSYFGIFSSITLFFNILIFGFVVKASISYWRSI